MSGRLVDWMRRRQRAPVLRAILIAPAAGGAMQSVGSGVALVGRGLAGDRYAAGAGHWRSVDSCEVTLITDAELDQATRRAARREGEALAAALAAGSHRRNLVVSGVDPQELNGRRFGLGDAVFRYHKPRPPCGYIDQICGAGTCRALGRHSGICLRVVAGGRFEVGHPLVLLDRD